MNGAPLTGEEIQAIAQLPSREVLYGRLVGMVASPLTGLASALNGLIGGLARQLSQIAEQGLVGGDAPAPQAAADPEPTESAPPDPDSEPTESAADPGPEPDPAPGESPAEETPTSTEETQED
jgi:large subunit ribosomal protein L10